MRMAALMKKATKRDSVLSHVPYSDRHPLSQHRPGVPPGLYDAGVQVQVVRHHSGTCPSGNQASACSGEVKPQCCEPLMLDRS